LTDGSFLEKKSGGVKRRKNLALNKKARDPDLPLCCLNCTKFGKLILGKIGKMSPPGVAF